MGPVPMQPPAGVVQTTEPPPRPPRPPRRPSCRLESIPELRQIELGASSQQDGPLPGIGFVRATMGQGPPPPGFVPPDLAEEMAARARKVLRLTPIREKIDPNSPTTKLIDFYKEGGGAARLVNLEVIIRQPGKGPPFLEAAEHTALEAAEAAAETAAGSSTSSTGSSQPSPDGPVSTGGKRRAVSATHSTRERRAAKAATTAEEELRHQLEQHRRQLANTLSWLNHAVADRDHYAREKIRLYEILERDKALYQEAIDTAPSASPPSSPTFLNAALYVASSAAAAALPSSSSAPCGPPPAPPLPVLDRKGKGVMRSSPPADDAWKEWMRNSPPSWAIASSPPCRPAPPPPVPGPSQKHQHHCRPLPSAPGSSSAVPGSLSYPPPPPRAPRLGASALKVHYSTHASSSSSSPSGVQEEHRLLRQQQVLPPFSAPRPSPLRHEVSMRHDDERGQQSVELAPVPEQQQQGIASSGRETVEKGPKLVPLLPAFDGPWGNTCFRSVALTPDLGLLNTPFL